MISNTYTIIYPTEGKELGVRKSVIKGKLTGNDDPFSLHNDYKYYNDVHALV